MIYGRNAVLEALLDKSLAISKIHLADSNRSAKVLDQIINHAEQRSIDIEFKSKLELSRISKSSKQDQGVAADIKLSSLFDLEDLTDYANQQHDTPLHRKLILLDGVTNPQNVGMIIRSVAASGIGGLILPSSGCADLGPLVIKASAGAIFKCPIFRCDTTQQAIECVHQLNGKVYSLALDGSTALGEEQPGDSINVYVLGNESEGVSKKILKNCDDSVFIPMHNGVESLNVAVTAALIAFAP